jgi:hypothetical protein
MHIKINTTLLDPNFLLVPNKPGKPTNTSIAFIDLDLHIYDENQA